MDNHTKQLKLDKKKWFASIEAGKDMGGRMDYCEFCDRVDPVFGGCNATQTLREKCHICATADNRRERAKRKAK